MSTKIWHDRFEDDWMRAFPLGNGRIGAMLYGNPQRERIEINEESLWSGRQIEETNNCSSEALERIRKLLFEERFKEAADLSKETFLAEPKSVRFYESFGEIFIDFGDREPYKNYKKELRLSEATANVSYEKGGVSYQSEAFVSEEYDALIYKVQTDDKPFCCNVTMKREQDARTSVIDDSTLFVDGKIIYKSDPMYGEGGEGMSFGARVCVVSDGEIKSGESCLNVKNATYVIIYGAFATNYNVLQYDIDETIDYKKKLIETTERIKKADYEEIKAKHIKSHKALFDKVSFNLNAPIFEDVPTDERLRRVREEDTEDNDLYVLYYNFGRYLLLESSAKRATLPANLQGIWSSGFTPPWGSDYHTNINLQMNYWPAEPANMAEAMQPFIHFMKMMKKFGTKTARELFFANGWTINHTTDIFGRTGIHDGVQWGFFPMAGPWLCLNLWEHYEFADDKEFLKEIYPVLKGSCEFIKDYLTPGDDGFLYTNPSNSPENSYYYTDENGEQKKTKLTYGATIDFEIIYALFTRVIYACDILGCDEAFSAELREILLKLPPLKISKRYGTICEWVKDYEEVEPGHRHISHLFGLYPSDQINEADEGIYQAAKKTIGRRLSHDGGATGWSRAWIINFYARLKDGENAFYHLKKLLQCSTADNLFDMHPPFQIDGNFGGISGITEMLVGSHMGAPGERITEILPALTKKWKSGSIKGVKVRGNFELDIFWEDCRPARLVISSPEENIFRLKLTDSMKNFKTDKEYSVTEAVMVMRFKKNEKCEIVF